MYDEPMSEGYPIPQTMMGGHTSEGALQYQIDAQQIIDKVEHSLKGEIPQINKDGRMTWVQRPDTLPIINQKGINRVLTVLQTTLNQIFILSDLEKENVENITISIGQTMIDDLYFNWDEYEIRDTAAASLIVGIVTNTVYATLRKGFQGNYLKFLRTSQQISEVQHRVTQATERQQPQQQDGFWGTLKRIGKGR